MKHFRLVWICCLLFLILGLMIACTPAANDPADTADSQDVDTTAQETSPETTVEEATSSNTEFESSVNTSDTEPETSVEIPITASVSILPNTLTVEGDKVQINVTVSHEGIVEANAPQLVFALFDADNKELDRQSFDLVNGTADYALTCQESNANSELTVFIEACGEPADDTEVGIIWDTATLSLKNGLPQLTPDGIRCVVAAMTLEEKAHLVTGTQNIKLQGASGGTYEILRLGVPSITVNDGPAGIRYGNSVWYPSVINISSSWDTELAKEIGVSMAEDALAKDIDIILAPGMNIQKNVLGGRNFEYISEDPILTALISTSYTQGIQSQGVGVSIKHFAANNQESSRGSVSANVTERALREIYLKAFGMTIQAADPYTIMSSYNLVNGQRVATRYDMLTTYLREENGFAGFVMSDWGSGGTVAEKVNAGNDINMPGNATDPQDLMNAFGAGLVDEMMLDAACRNILSVVSRCHSYTDPDQKTKLDILNHGKQIADAAADTMVLLKNDTSTLPLMQGTSVAVFGNGAYKTVYGGEGSGNVYSSNTVSIFQGIKNYEHLTIANESGNPFANCEPHSAVDSSKDVVITASYAQSCAQNANVAIIVISRSSTEGADRSTVAGDYLLNQTEFDMISHVSDAFHAQGKKVVVLLNTGSPIEVISWQDKVDALLWVGYPGERAGTSVARVLTGEVNPSAKTTITWPVDYMSTPSSKFFPGNASNVLYYEDIYVGYRYYNTFDVNVTYPFGYGLSYTAFTYKDFTIEKQDDNTLVAHVTVTNTGNVEGRDIVQVYVSKPENTLEQAAIELAGFGKTKLLKAGESQTLTIAIPVEAMESYDTVNSRYYIENGTFTFSVGASSEDIKHTVELAYDTLTVTKDVTNIAPPDGELVHIQKSTYEVPDIESRKENIAIGKTAWDNGCENENLAAQFAVDGDYMSRWSGLGASVSIHNWFLDLGEAYDIGEIIINWESLHVPFTLYTSLDGNTYTSVGTFSNEDGSGINTINLHGDSARYFKLIGPAGTAFSIYEFAVYQATQADIDSKPDADETKGENIAIGKQVTATNHEGSYLPQYAIDGNIETRWGSLPSGEAWLQVDLEEITTISQIKLFLESAWVPYLIEISTDGRQYETIYNGKKDEVFVILDDLEVEARYVRLWRDGENWFSIIELEIYQ